MYSVWEKVECEKGIKILDGLDSVSIARRGRRRRRRSRMAKLRRRNERRAMKVVEGVDDGRRGEQGQVAKAEDRKRKRGREPKRRRWLTAPGTGCLTFVVSGERAGHVGKHCREHDECPVAVGPHGRPFTEGTEFEKKRERLNEIVDDSLKTLYRLERICWAHCWLSVDWDVLCARRSISRTVTPLGTFHTAVRVYPSGRKLPPQWTDSISVRTSCATARRTMGPHTFITRILIPADASAVSVTTNFSSRIHEWILHTYLKPIAPPRAPYHWLLPQFLAQWYSLARVHLLFRSATAAVAADVVSLRWRERQRERWLMEIGWWSRQA